MAAGSGEAQTTTPASDEQVLERFGYRQELKRSLGYFSAFALSFSVISVTRAVRKLWLRPANWRAGIYLDLAHCWRRATAGRSGIRTAGAANPAFRLCLSV